MGVGDKGTWKGGLCKRKLPALHIEEGRRATGVPGTVHWVPMGASEELTSSREPDRNIW